MDSEWLFLLDSDWLFLLVLGWLFQADSNKVYDQIFKPAIEAAGYEAYRVDEDKISNPIINKIFDAVQNCPMALCDLSNRESHGDGYRWLYW